MERGHTRASVLAALILVPSIQLARGADESCREYRSAAGHIEWIENGEHRGARFVSRATEWGIGRLGAVARCASCLGDLMGATVWLYAGGGLERDLDQRIAPDAVARNFHPVSVEVQAKTEPVSVSISDLAGRARVLTVRVLTVEPPEQSSGEVIAVSAEKDCLSLSGILVSEAGMTLRADQLALLDAAIGIEWYKPEYDAEALKPPPRHDDGLLLGDARRRAQEGR